MVSYSVHGSLYNSSEALLHSLSPCHPHSPSGASTGHFHRPSWELPLASWKLSGRSLGDCRPPFAPHCLLPSCLIALLPSCLFATLPYIFPIACCPIADCPPAYRPWTISLAPIAYCLMPLASCLVPVVLCPITNWISE